MQLRIKLSLPFSHILPGAQFCNIILLNRVIHLHIVYFHHSCTLSERASEWSQFLHSLG